MNIEPLVDPKNSRLTMKPIDPKYKPLWDLYKKQMEHFWKAEEIDFSGDRYDYEKLNKHEQKFIKTVLAFFAASDGIVNFNLSERFLQEITVMEARTAYGFQLMMENIHSEVYSDMLDNIIASSKEREFLFNAIENIPAIKLMKDWAFKWIESDKSLGHRVIAFAIVEGVFFCGAFAAIFWLKKIKGSGQLFMEGLNKSNKFISRDESLHVNFACLLYSYIINKVPMDEVNEIFNDAVNISKNFCDEALQVDMIGMNNDLMFSYIKYTADRLLVNLGYKKLYNETNPFDFMETIGIDSKDNFFETRPDSYQTADNDTNKNWIFKLDNDF